MSTIHAYTATQKTVDGPSGKVLTYVCVYSDSVMQCMRCSRELNLLITQLLISFFLLSIVVCFIVFVVRNGGMVVVLVRMSSQPPLELPRLSARLSQNSMGELIATIHVNSSFSLLSTLSTNSSVLCFFCVSRKLTGMAFRVPVPDVSVVDLTVRLKNGVRILHMLSKLDV